MAEVCCHLPKGGRGSAAPHSCATEIRQTALPGLEGKAGLKGQQGLAHPGDHASLTASGDHIQVLGSTCPPNPGGAGVVSRKHSNSSPFPKALVLGTPHCSGHSSQQHQRWDNNVTAQANEISWPWEAQSSPRVARESWGWRSRAADRHGLGG